MEEVIILGGGDFSVPMAGEYLSPPLILYGPFQGEFMHIFTVNCFEVETHEKKMQFPSIRKSYIRFD